MVVAIIRVVAPFFQAALKALSRYGPDGVFALAGLVGLIAVVAISPSLAVVIVVAGTVVTLAALLILSQERTSRARLALARLALEQEEARGRAIRENAEAARALRLEWPGAAEGDATGAADESRSS